jgi:hypothetical protein
MNPDRGTYSRLSLPRRWMCDFLHASRGMPLVPLERRMDLSRLAEAKAQVRGGPGWCALFTLAFARMARARPVFRRSYVPFPWARIYEHPHCVAAVAIEREYLGEPAVFFGMIRDPASLTIVEVEAQLRDLKHCPVEENFHFRRMIQVARYPRFVRRFLWWYMLRWSGPIAAQNAGTFGISVTAATGCTALSLISPVPYTLNYAPIDERGFMNVRLHLDHRLIDGGPAAAGMTHLEDLLNVEMVDELQQLESAESGERGPEVAFTGRDCDDATLPRLPR